MDYSSLQFWLVPVAIALIWIVFLFGKLIMIPMRILVRLSLLAVPIWIALNWNALQVHLHR